MSKTTRFKLFISIFAFLTVSILLTGCQTVPEADQKNPQLLAHRGLAQTFDISKVQWDTNTAAIIYPPEHPYIENTLPSMEIAFSYGADIVEFDIRVTKDKDLAVFHDYLVDYRTEKQGLVSDYTLAELKTMDVGYGYTADGGQTYPLRGTGVGLLPSFDEVMQRFPDKKFLVHIRDGGEEIGKILLEKFRKMDKDQTDNIAVYGNDTALGMIRKEYPEMLILSAKTVKRAVIDYMLVGWSGYVPKSMRNIHLHLPIEFARFLWGWPHRFLDRISKVNSRMVLVIRRGQWSGGFDTEEDLKKIPKNYSGFIWTDRIDRIGEFYKEKALE